MRPNSLAALIADAATDETQWEALSDALDALEASKQERRNVRKRSKLERALAGERVRNQAA